MRFPRKTALALLVAIAALAVLHLLKPSLGLSLSTLLDPWRPPHKKSAAAGTQQAGTQQALPTQKLQSQTRPPLAPYLFDDAGALDPFFARLAALESPASDDRLLILHYGDSPTTADLITGDIRALLQARFGDAGSGYLLPAKPWAWYSHWHTDIVDRGWSISTAVGKGHAETYGLGGASFTGSPGASSHITLKDAAISTVPSEMVLSFLAEPNGGTLSITPTGPGGPTGPTASQTISLTTAADIRQPAWRAIALPPNTKAVDLKVTAGHVELFGESFVRQQRGIVYDSLGLNGASTTVLSRGFNPDDWQAELKHDAPALVVINYGTNESNSAAFVDRQYEGELRRAIGRIRAALPDVAILIMSPMDRGERHGIDQIETMATIPRIVATQKRVAADTRCAFFSTFDAMGGDGTMARWYTGHPRMVAADLIHPSPQGAAIIAQIFVKNLLQGYDTFHAEHTPPPAVASTQKPPPE